MGIACAPRLFTKLMKPVYATLRGMGHLNVGYIDDSLLISDAFDECQKNLADSRHLMQRFGLVINEKKSVCIPSQIITFLGHIDSERMLVILTLSRENTIVIQCKRIWKREICSVRELGRVMGLIVASFSAVEFGPS